MFFSSLEVAIFRKHDLTWELYGGFFIGAEKTWCDGCGACLRAFLRYGGTPGGGNQSLGKFSPGTFFIL